jgi:hypothetical protein
MKTLVDLAATPGKILLYTTPRPASGGDVPAGTLLATVILSDPCGTVDATGLHFTADAPVQAVAAGVVVWGRLCDGDGNWIIDGDARRSDDIDVGHIADAIFVIDEDQVYVGSFITLVSATLAEGG